MNKVDLVSDIASISGLKKVDAEKALAAIIEAIKEGLKSEEEVRLIGFGTFSVTQRAETTGRNLKTGQIIKIPSKKVPKFKPGKQLKDAVLGE